MSTAEYKIPARILHAIERQTLEGRRIGVDACGKMDLDHKPKYPSYGPLSLADEWETRRGVYFCYPRPHDAPLWAAKAMAACRDEGHESVLIAPCKRYQKWWYMLVVGYATIWSPSSRIYVHDERGHPCNADGRSSLLVLHYHPDRLRHYDTEYSETHTLWIPRDKRRKSY